MSLFVGLLNVAAFIIGMKAAINLTNGSSKCFNKSLSKAKGMFLGLHLIIYQGESRHEYSHTMEITLSHTPSW